MIPIGDGPLGSAADAVTDAGASITDTATDSGNAIADGVTDASGAVADFGADFGNSVFGVNADNMGIFEENAAGSKAVSLATLGLGGEGGLVSDVLMPGQGKPGEHPTENDDSDGNKNESNDKQQQRRFMIGLGLALLVGLAVVMSS